MSFVIKSSTNLLKLALASQFLVFFLSACGGAPIDDEGENEPPAAEPTPTVLPTTLPTPQVTPTAEPVSTPTPRVTPTSMPVITPTPTQAPTATPTPTPTPTPMVSKVEITLNGEDPYYLEMGEEYVEFFAIAQDESGNNLNVEIYENVDISTPGIYNVTYSATDKNGKQITKQREVHVSDTLEPSGNYLRGEVQVHTGEGNYEALNIYVQRFKKNNGAWTQEPGIDNDDRSPKELFLDSKALWKSFYNDLNQRGMPPEVIKLYVQGISGPRNAGAYHETGLNVCSYSGVARRIGCGTNTAGNGLKNVIAHESTHGWEWMHQQVGEIAASEGIGFRDHFTLYSNIFYHLSQDDPSALSGPGWQLNWMNYGLQNDAEWGSEVFVDWLRKSGPHWGFMNKNLPEYISYFDCLWLDGKSMTECAEENLASLGSMSKPEYYPINGASKVAAVEGFSDEDAHAVWSICTRAKDANQQKERFNKIVWSVAPDLPGSPADHYRMGIGDCNHDGTYDWVCWYDGGPGPNNERYLWNGNNKKGTYSFIASGKPYDTYVEYLPDPYTEIYGALAQPMYREWQGKYGSCNGAQILSRYHWKDEWLRDIPKD